jgi:hypothetical protein
MRVENGFRTAEFVYFLFGVTLGIAAEAPTRQVWSIAGSPTVFRFDSVRRTLVDERCATQGPKCMALRKLPEANLSRLSDDDRDGGKNPGGGLCKKVLGGTVVMGLDADKNQSSFCLFSDGSLIDCGSLYVAAIRNRAPSPR